MYALYLLPLLISIVLADYPPLPPVQYNNNDGQYSATSQLTKEQLEIAETAKQVVAAALHPCGKNYAFNRRSGVCITCSTVMQTWDAAASTCASQGGSLPTPTSDYDLNFIKQTCLTKARSSAWIGSQQPGDTYYSRPLALRGDNGMYNSYYPQLPFAYSNARGDFNFGDKGKGDEKAPERRVQNPTWYLINGLKVPSQFWEKKNPPNAKIGINFAAAVDIRGYLIGIDRSQANFFACQFNRNANQFLVNQGSSQGYVSYGHGPY